MQCPSCHFQNMPGSQNCARCAALLSVGEINVLPPRATSMQRRVPLQLWVSGYRLRLATSEFLARLSGVLPLRSRAAREYPSLSLPPRPIRTAGRDQFHGGAQELELQRGDWGRLSIPGWVQMRHGEVRGRWFLVGMLGFLGLAVVFAGTAWGAVFLGALFSWHLMATVDATVRRFASFLDRVRFTCWIALLLGVLLYAPVLWSISRVATPVRINHATRYFEGGDVVWYCRSVRPGVGDLVLYEVPAQTLAGRQGPMAVNVRIQGQRINRLVAVEGQTLSWQDNQLWVDGMPSLWQPRSPRDVHPAVVHPGGVPAGYVYVLPEDLVPFAYQTAERIDASLGMVPRSSVHGVVFWRTHPFHRFEKL